MSGWVATNRAFGSVSAVAMWLRAMPRSPFGNRTVYLWQSRRRVRMARHPLSGVNVVPPRAQPTGC
jgi:hypothetical protein